MAVFKYVQVFGYACEHRDIYGVSSDWCKIAPFSHVSSMQAEKSIIATRKTNTVSPPK